MKNLLLRAFTGIAYVTVILACILINSYTFLALFCVVIALCLWEFYGLINNGKKVTINRFTSCIGGILLFVSSYLYASNAFSYIIFFPYLCYVVFIMVSELYQKKEDPLAHLAFTFLGQCYIALPFSLLNFLVFNGLFATETSTVTSFSYYPVLIVALFAFIWINDTGAYIVGVTIGKHRLFERISPKKSWEGFFGGLVFTIAASFVFGYFEPLIPQYHWLGIAVAVVIFGTWGDLIESLMKRTLGVKDSGHSLPGHGGFLDRFDSFLLAIYGMLFYIELFKIEG